MELLTRAGTPHFRLEEGRRLTWYACLFDVPAVIREAGQTYTEVIRAGAFSASLAGPGEVVANIDHDDQFAFAQRSNGSLLLQEDPKGLFCSCWLPDTALGDEIINKVQSGRLNGASFRFSPVVSDEAGGVVERQAVIVADVCLTATPAYPDTIGEVHIRTHARNTRVRYLLTLADYVRKKWKWANR